MLFSFPNSCAATECKRLYLDIEIRKGDGSFTQNTAYITVIFLHNKLKKRSTLFFLFSYCASENFILKSNLR